MKKCDFHKNELTPRSDDFAIRGATHYQIQCDILTIHKSEMAEEPRGKVDKRSFSHTLHFKNKLNPRADDFAITFEPF